MCELKGWAQGKIKFLDFVFQYLSSSFPRCLFDCLLYLNRPVKSTLLDILLLRASGWKIEDEVVKQESEGSSMEDEVLVEPEDDLTEEQLQEGTGNVGDSEGMIW